MSFGTTLPELSFSAKAIKHRKDAMAVGDVLGSVLADATIVVGIVAMIAPFTFSQTITYVAGGFMVASSIVLLVFMKSKLKITHREAWLLIAVWAAYIVTELISGKVIS